MPLALASGSSARDCCATAARPIPPMPAYARVVKLSTDSRWIETAWWERAHEAEEQGEWSHAMSAYLHTAELKLAHARESRFRSAIIELVLGRASAARVQFARLDGDGARFWWALAARDSDRAAADSALSPLARQPGTRSHRAAARDSLGLGGEADPDVRPAPRATPDAALEFIDDLLHMGFRDDALALLDRWSADDIRAGAPSDSLRHHPRLLLCAADVEQRAGRLRESIHLAERAAAALADSGTPPGSP